MTREYFTARLGPMASRAYQQRFGLGGTRDEYILLDEVREGVGECIRVVVSGSDAAAFLTAGEKASIQALDPIYRGLPALRSWSEALDDAQWGELRSAAEKALAVMGFNMAAWEQQELSSKHH